MQGGSVCHITHTNTTQTPAEHNQTSWIPKPNTEHSSWREFTFYSQSLSDFAVVSHPSDAAGCPGVFNISNHSRVLNFCASQSCCLNFDIQTQVLLGRATTGTCRVLTALKCQICCHKMLTKIPVDTSQEAEIYLSSSSAALIWVWGKLKWISEPQPHSKLFLHKFFRAAFWHLGMLKNEGILGPATPWEEVKLVNFAEFCSYEKKSHLNPSRNHPAIATKILPHSDCPN